MLNWCFDDCKDCEITQWVSQSSIETEHNNLDRSAGSSQNYSEIGQRYFMAIRTYFTRWLILMNSYDLTRTI